ncbi:DUF4233 domain-containing protein [Actinomycetospora sp. NBRC 106378]|uniref:DUF4233 domain-containing protein n=1 Tax=Actinomycetospora sp. NBRC 106378 TaxID=3032208 RepID=UPI0024A11593|nr:DUF4233 domain-containing protein [Actinomycetospora sp. NBRC 106378]GLZ55267.1 membrane protein [Actinomycetospora sp. NBRC 106378]
MTAPDKTPDEDLRPPDPRRAFRGPASACLVLEAIAVPLVLPVMNYVEGGITAPKLTLVLVLTVGMIVGCVVILRPWGLPFAVGLQVLMLLGWVLSPSLGVLGLIFCLVWALMLWMRREVIRRQEAWFAPR